MIALSGLLPAQIRRQGCGMSGEITYPAEIVSLRALANATPNPCEGSRGDLRDTFAWQIEDDYRRANEGDASIRSEFLDDPTCAEIVQMCITDATNALARWVDTDARS